MKTLRQEKVNQLLKKDLSVCIDELVRSNFRGLMISVAGVNTSVDLGVSKVYLSIFPSEKSAEALQFITDQKSWIKQKLASINRHVMRRLPDLLFYIDRSLDEVEAIEAALKEKTNPII